jgi:hypothetical protein
MGISVRIHFYLQVVWAIKLMQVVDSLFKLPMAALFFLIVQVLVVVEETSQIIFLIASILLACLIPKNHRQKEVQVQDNAQRLALQFKMQQTSYQL